MSIELVQVAPQPARGTIALMLRLSNDGPVMARFISGHLAAPTGVLAHTSMPTASEQGRTVNLVSFSNIRRRQPEDDPQMDSAELTISVDVVHPGKKYYFWSHIVDDFRPSNALLYWEVYADSAPCQSGMIDLAGALKAAQRGHPGYG